MTYLTNNNAIVLFLSTGEKIRVEKSDSKYAKILGVFDLPTDQQEGEVKKILKTTILGKKVVEEFEGFQIVDDQVHYQGERLPLSLEQKVLSIVEDGLPLGHFEKFWERLQKNPSSSSVNELMDFLSYKELPITDDGHFIAYRGVRPDYYSVHGNTNTKVKQGKVNDGGHIFNGIGEVIEVLRRDVDDNRAQECSYGLHIGSLNYAAGWGSKVVVVKVDPADVVSVPKDANFQKCRVCKYEVLYDFVGEITSSVVKDDGSDELVEEIEDDAQEVCDARLAFIDRVEQYLVNKADQGYTEVTVRQIQNAFSPLWPSKQSVLDALQELWVDWHEDGTNIIVELAD